MRCFAYFRLPPATTYYLQQSQPQERYGFLAPNLVPERPVGSNTRNKLSIF
jgi:hypothetical protein